MVKDFDVGKKAKVLSVAKGNANSFLIGMRYEKDKIQLLSFFNWFILCVSDDVYNVLRVCRFTYNMVVVF